MIGMSRLIDADALIKELVSNEIQPSKDIENYIEGWCEGYNTVVDIINEQPTAYDVEKVVADIEEFYAEAEHYGFASALSDIVEVVKRGGVE